MSVKYLGVVLDSWLTWREHTDIEVRKAHNLLWASRRACGVTWRLLPRVAHWFYISIIRPSITFAALVWWPGCQTGSARKNLAEFKDLGIKGVMCTSLTNAVKALICLSPLELVTQSEARSAAHCPWSLGSWSYLHSNRGHTSILMRFQESDPILNMGVDVMGLAINFEPKYRVTMLTRAEWTRELGSSGLQMSPG